MTCSNLTAMSSSTLGIDSDRSWVCRVTLADQIPALDAAVLPLGTPVLLHTEVMREHLLVTEGPDDCPSLPSPLSARWLTAGSPASDNCGIYVVCAVMCAIG